MLLVKNIVNFLIEKVKNELPNILKNERIENSIVNDNIAI